MNLNTKKHFKNLLAKQANQIEKTLILMGENRDLEEYYTNDIDLQGIVDPMDRISNEQYKKQLPWVGCSRDQLFGRDTINNAQEIWYNSYWI